MVVFGKSGSLVTFGFDDELEQVAPVEQVGRRVDAGRNHDIREGQDDSDFVGRVQIHHNVTKVFPRLVGAGRC